MSFFGRERAEKSSKLLKIEILKSVFHLINRFFSNYDAFLLKKLSKILQFSRNLISQTSFKSTHPFIHNKFPKIGLLSDKMSDNSRTTRDSEKLK